jgi:hypothetical protein
MIAKTIAVSLALLCLSEAAFAQDLSTKKHTVLRVADAKHETLDAGMARLAVKAAFQPSAQPTQQELLGIILLMSLREQRGNHT